MDAKVIIELLRAGLAINGAIRAWTETASTEQLKSLVQAMKADGVVDMGDVQGTVAQLTSSLDALDAKLKAAGA